MGREVIAQNNTHLITLGPLYLLRIDLKVAEKNNEILKICLLLHVIVNVELSTKKLTIPQCYDYKAYIHTTGYSH
jgi:hypothetical protein